MNKYNVIEKTIIFYNQRNKVLANVNYTLIFCPKQGSRTTYTGVTDDKGQTKPVEISANGKLHILVQGHETIFSPKKLIKPVLADGTNVIEIQDSRLENNIKFITKEQFELQQEKSKKLRAELKELVKKNPKGNFFNLSKMPPAFNHGVHKLEESFDISYEEYKKKNTTIIKSRKYLKFKMYVLYRFVDSRGKGIPNMSYQVFGEGQSKPLVGFRPTPTDQKGYTKQADTHLKSQIKYQMGSTSKTSEWYEPITCVDKQDIRLVVFPTASANTNPDINNKASLGENQKPPIVINPSDNEVLVLPPALYAEFDRKTKILSDAIKEVHHSNSELTRAIQSRNLEQIKELEKRLNINQEKAIEKINGEFKQVADLKEVWIVETTGEKNQSASKYNLARRYLRVSDYKSYSQRRLNEEKEVKIKQENGQVAPPSLIKKEFDKLAKQLLTAKKSVGGDKAVYNLIGGLGGEIAEEYVSSSDITVSQEAQWMRMVAGSSAEGMISASSKGVKMKVSGDASAKWTLFEGVKEWRKFYPCESGWALELGNYDLGTIRFLIGAELSGFSGANLGIAGNLSVDISYQGTTQVLTAAVREPGQSMSNMLNRERKPMFQPAKGDLKEIAAAQESGKPQATAGINAFVGAQIQGVLKGGIEWFKPNIDKGGEGKFVTIAAATGGGGVSAGAGAQGQFQIIYDDGCFKIRAAAHLCWGVGAKGVATFTVGTEHILNYIGFIKLQLLQAGFRSLVYIAGQAFSVMAQVLAYCIGDDHLITRGVEFLSEDFSRWIDSLDKDQQRLKTANHVNSAKGREELIIAPPETKGILLYAVTHWSHSTAPIFDIHVSFSELEVKYFPARKTAVINILKTCITTAEWQNTIQHIHPLGEKLTRDQFGKVEGDLIRFLNYGENPKYAEDIIRCINQGIDYAGTNINQWLKDYLKYRKGAKAVTGTSWNYMLVRNQDDQHFEQFKIQQGISRGFEEQTLMASNLEILAPFEQDESEKVYHV
ncbi:hypothetical protein [Acinetobacter sp. YK3]|uniref:hypothetical protein n=1 Tax=Acinetobacter sp. YK3 TaxID=1860097 RepID=UPI00084BEACA|nr:hypothetical protein [Acinetobacter sp. YK3]OEC92417.1 hypothetical protein A9Z07_14900 [Acinetobacter sp. YK3]